jgi:hypothetical protein
MVFVVLKLIVSELKSKSGAKSCRSLLSSSTAIRYVCVYACEKETSSFFFYPIYSISVRK